MHSKRGNGNCAVGDHVSGWESIRRFKYAIVTIKSVITAIIIRPSQNEPRICESIRNDLIIAEVPACETPISNDTEDDGQHRTYINEIVDPTSL